MSGFGDLAAARGSGTPYDALVPVPGARIAAIARDWPGVPGDFLTFLGTIGAGSLRGGYQLHDGLVPAGELYDSDAAVALFGDDLRGVGHGFALPDGQVVELDATDGGVRPVATSFAVFVRVTIGELA
ncbi:hypothetical protein ASE67_17025 [Sphingomonas sp. Leaf23]|uniref:hypothetical protein n=1 Tax=Sphingomonas sp. Leaf23 TaxID=1735689 RepID=UPI0006FE1580|nr:hypothetical protein [Sphingomonas sp. Leaf23]KQM81649.1 hypothetical protein ASE67_17025 [Sphingomonas sp. Leaf23]